MYTTRARVAKLGLVSLLVSSAVVLLYGYAETDVSNGGTLRGTVRLEGAPPPLAAHKVTRSPEVCGQTVPNEEVVTGSGGALANVVVWIDRIATGAPIKRRPLVLDQQGCRFVPHVAAVPVGTSIVLTSSDATLHTTHVLIGAQTIFNVALPAKGMRVTKRLDRAGIHRIKCEAGHTWMSAWIHVRDNPYQVVTGRDGRFELPPLPAGSYTVKAWHERFGELSNQVEVAAGGSATSDFRFRSR